MEKIRANRDGDHRQRLDEIKDVEMHVSNLHDQDEDISGELRDLATGERIDNSTDHGFQVELVTDIVDGDYLAEKEEDAGRVGMGPDDADRWLQENDPNYGK
ncbi:hypothetical protein KC845_03200 [Candidatus Kaiserbacteria bacterium]|nr:hypothetical protein [Candidatus Kaiserbacteria bacterium]